MSRPFQPRNDDNIEYAHKQATKIELACPDRIKNLVINAVQNKAIPTMSIIVGEFQTRISILELTTPNKFKELDYIISNQLLKNLGYADLTN